MSKLFLKNSHPGFTCKVKKSSREVQNKQVTVSISERLGTSNTFYRSKIGRGITTKQLKFTFCN